MIKSRTKSQRDLTNRNPSLPAHGVTPRSKSRKLSIVPRRMNRLTKATFSTNDGTSRNPNSSQAHSGPGTRERDSEQRDPKSAPQSRPDQQATLAQTQAPPPPKQLFKTTNNARVKDDVAVDTSVTREHLARFAHLFDVRSPQSDAGKMIYNTSSGAHPALTFALYPNPLTNPQQYETALAANKIYPRYSYHQDVEGSLEYIRGVHYLPQYGLQHLLSQGRVEIFHPFFLNHQLKYVIQAGLPNSVDQHEKHRDRIELSPDGKVLGIHPPRAQNQYYTALERNQIQTKEGKLCADYQVQHLFYNQDNNIVVTAEEQHDRQRLEQIYESLKENKAQELLEELRELTIKTDVEILPDRSQSQRARHHQLSEDLRRKEQLQKDIHDLGGVPSTNQRYFDISHNAMRITKENVFTFLTLTSNNNKLCFNDRFSSFNGHDGVVIPMEYLASLALQELAAFIPQFAPSEPQIWKDVKHEAIVLEQEHLRDELLGEKVIKWKAYDKYRKKLKKYKQDSKYEDMYREHQQKANELAERVEKRRAGETTGIFSAVMDTRSAVLEREIGKKLPLPEEIEVSEEEAGRDPEFDVFQNETEVTLNKDEIDYIKEKTTPPPWHQTFQQMRRYEFRSLVPATIRHREANFFDRNRTIADQYTELNFYARLVEDSFDYRTYNHVIAGAMEEFDLQLKQVRAGLIKEDQLDIGKMVSFSDICRDKPLEIEVWFEIPGPYDELKARAERIRESDPRQRPTTGTRVFTGIVTIDAPSSFHFMGLSEDQMKRLFALRQGITITKM